ncbi:transposase [Escherichia coli]|nr:transposase [Escherichia coli]GDA51763.1 transposase [Escherichia coli]GDB44746.1 transposase [Escherichia coli]GDC27045.1 transposase [Escherichia coli]
MAKNTRFFPEVRQRAVRMVLENQGEYDSQWAAICSIVPKIGCTPETLRVWCTASMSGIPGADRYAVNCILPRQRIITVSNSDIILRNAVPLLLSEWHCQ